jgi:sulfate adenylyltransferase subunit 2
MPDAYLSELESESIEIIREVIATASKPVMMYSIGKDSSVMLRLAQKSAYPGPIPFPLLHIDTGWKFREMIAFRDRTVAEVGVELLTYTNPRGVAEGIGPVSHGSSYHTDIMKTEALRQALDLYGFDAAFGGARRDEEKSRAKERIFSFRTPAHRWEPKRQRPELWNLYIRQENIPIVPLYFAAPRPVVKRLGQWIMVDDNRLPLEPDETPELRVVRFRTLGCYPLTAAIESTATTLDEVVAEALGATTSERHGRAIDHDGAGSMERKKQEGYF